MNQKIVITFNDSLTFAGVNRLLECINDLGNEDYYIDKISPERINIKS